MQTDKNTLQKILQDRFGFSNFRDGQLEAIQTLLEKNHLLCIQPTGYGKSLLYQLPSVLLPNITLVISPLLALMRDQLSHLTHRFNIKAASINTDQTDEENFQARESARNGKIKILFVAPEQLDNLERFNFLISLPISLIVIDEAHCISTWGHDFRPSYRQIIKLIQQLEQKNTEIKILGLTATANHQTENDIKQQLSINKPLELHRATMDRPNIQLSCFQLNTFEEKLKAVIDLISQLDGDGLIYCATRENTELVAEFCRLNNIVAMAYHAGFDQNKKRELQHNFIHGKYKVIVATNALGMGIDKSDLRFIIHFDVPGSITAYYQEIGRCGRDGKLANGILLLNEQDKKIQHHFIESAQPTPDDFDLILKTIRDTNEPAALNTIKRLTGLHPTRTQVVVAELAEQNFLEKTLVNGKQIYQLTENKTSPDLTRYKNQYKVKTDELDTMLHYGLQKNDCRMKILRKTLGDDFAKACGHCDICSNKPFFKIDVSDTKQILNWFMKKSVAIKAVHQHSISEGISILDGKLHSPAFIYFMQNRIHADDQMLGLNNEIIALIKTRINELKKYNIKYVIPIPSRTWVFCHKIANKLGESLQAKTMSDFLIWKNVPAHRQGELLNNDQRKHNVSERMTYHRNEKILDGDILLLDDYTGSGATLKEAARVLRNEAGFKGKIIPFTVAIIKWRLGQRGMI